VSAIFGGSGLKNKSRLDLYVSDINGVDTNPGTIAAPVKTLAGALAKITFTVVAFDVVIHVGAHAGAGYTWATIDGYVLIDGASIHVTCDGAGQPGEDGFTEVLASTVALAGSNDEVIKSAALAVDVYFDLTIEILDGAAAGDRRTLKKNTATDLLPAMRFTAAVAPGDHYRILRPAVAIAAPVLTSTTVICANIGSPIAIQPDSCGGAELTPRSALVLVNMRFETAAGAPVDWASLEFVSSLVRMFGVEFEGGFISSSGEIAMGLTYYSEIGGAGLLVAVLASVPALLASTTSWRGWGVAHANTTASRSLYFSGEGARYGVFVGQSLRVAGGVFQFYAGRLLITSAASGLQLTGGRSPAYCRLGTYGLVATPFLGVEIVTTTGTCINMTSFGTLRCANLGATAPLTLIATSGTGIKVDVFSVCDITSGHNFATGFSLTTTGWGVSVKRGGRCIVDHDMEDNIAATLGAFTLDELTGLPASALNGAGQFMASADGSVIISAD
jgi:hypothetical protein